jgi:DNA-3-methyladenine glycosylase II
MWFPAAEANRHWRAAIKHLRKDAVLREIIDRVGPCTLAPRRDYFVCLVQSILSQQVSVKAADAMYRKLAGRMPGRKVTPRNVLTFLQTAAEEEIKSCGLSRQKRGYVFDISQKWIDGTIQPRRFAKMSDEELVEHLTVIKGIGRWTVEMTLIFVLCRPDVWPVDDLGIQESVKRHFKMKDRPKAKEIINFADAWKPWRSVATWYLWRGKDGA